MKNYITRWFTRDYLLIIYGQDDWPSHCVWIVPGTIAEEM